MAVVAVLSPKLVSQACLPSCSPFWAALGGRCRIVSQACLPSWFLFWAALGCRCRLVSQACLPSRSLFWTVFGCRPRRVFQACPPSWFPFLGCPSGLPPLGISLLGCLIALVKMRCRPPPKNKVQWPCSPRAMACCCASSYSCSSCVSCHSASSLSWATLLRVWPSGGFEARGLKILRSWQG